MKEVDTLFYNAELSAETIYTPWIAVPRGVNVGILQVHWIGSPTGVFETQYSNDPLCFRERVRGVEAGASQVVAITPATLDNYLIYMVGAQPSGAPGTLIWQTTYLPAFLRLKYTGASGEGVANGWSAF